MYQFVEKEIELEIKKEIAVFKYHIDYHDATVANIKLDNRDLRSGWTAIKDKQ